MALPVAHGLVGAAIVAAFWPLKHSTVDRKALVLGAGLGILPDVDYVLTLMLRFPSFYHRGFSHSILFACLIGTISACIFGQLNLRKAAVFSAAAASHGILDVFVSARGGVELLWPVWQHRLALGVFDYPDFFNLSYSRANDVLVISGIRRLLEISVYEAGVAVPVLILVLVCRRYLSCMLSDKGGFARLNEVDDKVLPRTDSV